VTEAAGSKPDDDGGPEASSWISDFDERLLLCVCCQRSFVLLPYSAIIDSRKKKNNRKNESNLNYLYDLFFPFLFFLPYSAIIDSRKRKTIVRMNQT
jgi:hypothetical protein